MIITIDAADLGCIVFTYIHNGVATHFNVNKIIERAKRKEVFEAAIDRSFGKRALRHNGIEQHRLDRLLQVPTDVDFDPVHYVTWHNGEHVLVDGSHRYVASYLQNRATIKIKVLSFLEWQDCVIKLPDLDDPLKWVKGNSRIP